MRIGHQVTKAHFQRESIGDREGLDVLVCSALAQRGVPNGFSLRSRKWGGEEPFGTRDLCSRDREELAKALGLDRGVAHMCQVHGNQVLAIEEAPAEPPVCDGLATVQQGLALVVQTADCVPLIFWDEDKKAVAAAHAGWRGALAGVPLRALACLKERFDSQPASIHVAMGPAIGACCYEVGDEVVGAFRERFPHAEGLFLPGGRGRNHLNLIEANTLQLTEAGVPSEQIYPSGICTSCDTQQFYSYRKEGKGVGRLMGVIGVR